MSAGLIEIPGYVTGTWTIDSRAPWVNCGEPPLTLKRAERPAISRKRNARYAAWAGAHNPSSPR